MQNSKAEKILTVVDEPSHKSATCKNCKNNPCLEGTPVTLGNFVAGAYCRGTYGPKEIVMHGYTYKGGFEKHWGEQFHG